MKIQTREKKGQQESGIFNNNLPDSSIDSLQKKAKNGDLESQILLGEHFLLIKDYEKAANYYSLAASLGDADAAYFAGLCFAEEKNSARSLEEAMKFFKKGAEANHIKSCLELGRLFESLGDQKQALQCYKNAAEKGLAEGYYRAALSLLGELHDAKEVDQAFIYLKNAALQDHVDAQYLLGLILNAKGSSLGALQYLHQAAKNGHEEAKMEIESILEELSPGELSENSQIFPLLTELAENGSAVAQRFLGIHYWLTDNPSSKKTAIDLWKKAAEQGDVKSCGFIAYCFVVGAIENPNPLDEAIKYLSPKTFLLDGWSAYLNSFLEKKEVPKKLVAKQAILEPLNENEKQSLSLEFKKWLSSPQIARHKFIKRIKNLKSKL